MDEIYKKYYNNDRSYSDELRKFCVTLSFYSQKAYKYVRKMFKDALPSKTTLYNWCEKIGGNPGFTAESLNYISNKRITS